MYRIPERRGVGSRVSALISAIPTNIHYVVNHVGWGNVTGAIFTDRAEADKAFKDLAGDEKAAMLIDNAFQEISYYGRRIGRETEMVEWAMSFK